MDPLVSVIIPNYNAEQYIEKCIMSVLEQTYNNIEILVVDDGSTDESMKIVARIANMHDNITVLQQCNLNAAIARNRGIEFSNGKYLFFLDSDDVLYSNAIAAMVASAEKNNSNLVLGNYDNIDESGAVLRKCRIVQKEQVSGNAMSFVGVVPNPSTKLYSRKIVVDNGLAWGNVRIGQDLNFLLKYLLCCHTVSTVVDFIYGWRTVQGSISNSSNLRIFDIVECFRDVKRYYANREKHSLYEEYIAVIEYRHYYLQMEKQKTFRDWKVRKLIVDYFQLNQKWICLDKAVNYKTYQSDIIKCRMKLLLKYLYITPIYRILDNKFARKKK